MDGRIIMTVDYITLDNGIKVIIYDIDGVTILNSGFVRFVGSDIQTRLTITTKQLMSNTQSQANIQTIITKLKTTFNTIK